MSLFCGIPAIMEHPATWYDPPRPSSFLLPDIEYLVTLGAVLHLVHQCAFGAPWLKPTGLLSTLPGYSASRLALMPRRGKCTGGHEHQPLLGTTATSEFKTMQAKMYPLDLIVILRMCSMTLPRTFLQHCPLFLLLIFLNLSPLMCCSSWYPLIRIMSQVFRVILC